MREIGNGLSMYGGNFEFSRQTGCFISKIKEMCHLEHKTLE